MLRAYTRDTNRRDRDPIRSDHSHTLGRYATDRFRSPAHPAGAVRRSSNSAGVAAVVRQSPARAVGAAWHHAADLEAAAAVHRDGHNRYKSYRYPGRIPRVTRVAPL